MSAHRRSTRPRVLFAAALTVTGILAVCAGSVAHAASAGTDSAAGSTREVKFLDSDTGQCPPPDADGPGGGWGCALVG
ncbi:hypothetical protein [Streptomyces sp. SID3343]|uniref:hypothetical protein n=1 Tax=Streptomyces sp. SID3343 TaxID=2690260 RepID=UPI001370F17E|nr:hypothetical protein [Streptomyces sp. SID3343]MYW03397.1 hypothetical protein [Streptomyces sp. SID3343]